MRNSRSKIRKEYEGKKYLILILFLIILPAISIIPGYLGFKYLIVPNLFSNPAAVGENIQEQEVNTVQKEESIPRNITETEKNGGQAEQILDSSLELEGFDFFSIQVGSFSDRKNAEILEKQLIDKNMGAYVYESGGYKVITLSLMNRSHIDKVMTAIGNQYSDSFVVPTSIPNQAIKYDQSEATYIKQFKDFNSEYVEILKGLSANIYKGINKEIALEESKNNVNVVINELKKIESDLNKKEVPTRLKELHDEYLILTKNTINRLESLNTGSEGAFIIEGKNSLTKSLYDYLDFIMGIN